VGVARGYTKSPLLAILSICRIIYVEAKSFHMKIEAKKTEAIQLIVHWRSLSRTAIRANVQRAAQGTDTCAGNINLGTLLPALGPRADKREAHLSRA
jgi:hypothetical protein